MPKKKQKWNAGDVFVIRLKDNSYISGQILDSPMKNVVSCAIFNERSETISPISECCNKGNLISLVATSREQLDYWVWKVIGSKEIAVSKEEYPIEKYRDNGWVGARIYDASIVEEFADAFYGLTPWDDWADPAYLDNLLYKIELRPDDLLYSKVKKK